MLTFADFLLTETQTISQWLKSIGRLPLKENEVSEEEVRAIKEKVRQKLSTFPFFRDISPRSIDLFTSFFTYQILINYTAMKKGAYDWTSVLSRISQVLDRWWTNYGDYIAAHINDNRKMSLFNTTGYTLEQLGKDSEEWHERLALKQSRPGAEGRIVLDLSSVGWPGWKWVSLDKGYCKQEGDAAGHCGNAAHKEGDNILSLRDEQNRVHLTFIVNNKILGESKGRGNNKPSPKYHPAIIPLLLSPLINFVRGGGYRPENNFALDDLDEETRKQLIEKKPSFGMSYFDYMMKSSKGNLKSKLENIFGSNIERVYRKGNKNWVALKTFDELKEMYEFIKRFNKTDDFSRFDDIESYGVDSSDQAIQYALNDTPKEIQDAIEKYLSVNQGGFDDEEWNDMDINEKINNSDLEYAFRNALYSGYEIGAQDEAYKIMIDQLGSTDDNGFFINFNEHPWELTISVNDLKTLYNKYPDGMSLDDLSDILKLTYNYPYNGFNDFSREAFKERLLEELPEEVRKLIKKPEVKGKKKKFKEWLSQGLPHHHHPLLRRLDLLLPE